MHRRQLPVQGRAAMTFNIVIVSSAVCSLLLLPLMSMPFVASWQQQQLQQLPQRRHNQNRNRRNVLEDIINKTVGGAAVVAATVAANVVFIPAAYAEAQAQPFGDLGTRTPLPAVEMMGVPGDTSQFTTLSNGIKIKDFKIGTGTDTIQSQSSKQTVSIQCNGRLINTNAGITFYNTKNNNPDGFGAIPLTFTLGKGEAIPGLEMGMENMKKGGIRRIVIPPGNLSYNTNPSLEPKPMTDSDQRALDSVVNNSRRDSTVMFDVRLERFSQK